MSRNRFLAPLLAAACLLSAARFRDWGLKPIDPKTGYL